MAIRPLRRLAAPMLFAAALASSPTFATPTVTTYTGTTSVQLSKAFTSALSALHVTPSRQFPALLHGADAQFPIPAGQIDLANLHGEIIHSGGLNLRAGNTLVTLSDFIIDTTGASPVLTGLVSANGDVVARLPLFKLALTQAPIVHNYGVSGSVKLSGVAVSLSAEAAAALNAAFSVKAFSEGIPIGTATVSAYTLNTAYIP